MKIIKLTQGKEAWVDDCDYERVNQYKWYAHKGDVTWYAISLIDGKLVKMHRFLLNTPEELDVDHADHNGLDNRRENIRNCSRSENMQNRRPNTNCTSKYKGVYLKKITHRWGARIELNGKNKHIGYFDSEEAAAIAYNKTAIKLFGQFACLNVIVKPGETMPLFA